MENKKYVLPYPHYKQREMFLSLARFKVLNWGRRSGKSMGIGEYVMLKAIEKQGNYYIIAPTYRQAKNIFWADILKLLVPGAIVQNSNENELYIELKPMHYKLKVAPIWGHDIDVQHDETKPPSRIYLKGADNPDSLRGVALDGCVLDEFAFMEKGVQLWDKIIRPALADRVGWAIFSSTPNGRNNHFWEFVENAQRPEFVDVDKPHHNGWFYSHCTALDNPYFDKENTGEWENSRNEHERKGKMDEWLQEWEARFATPEKLIYRDFDKNIHIVPPSMIPDKGTYVIGMDFGYNDPFAVVFLLIDYEDNWWVYDEIYEPGMTTSKEVAALRMKMGDKHFARIVGDNQMKVEIQNLREHKIWVTPSAKGGGSIQGGIQLVREQLQVRESTGRPKLFVSSSCVNFISEIGVYEYLTDAFGTITDTPAPKQADHLMDALRYIATTVRNAQKAPPKAQSRYSSTGRKIS